MLNAGEQIVASYLRYIRKCDFIQTNLYTKGEQGEIDVVGINLSENRVYLCEVAIHLITGLFYGKGGQYNNIDKLTDKFSKDIEYARKYLHEYKPTFMLWSPIITDSKGKAENNQTMHLEAISNNIRKKYKVEIKMVVNEKFQACLDEMRDFAEKQTEVLQCPIMRFMQIEAYLKKHLTKKKKCS